MIRKRCAIYTRKSTEEGLEQEFNSLDAQGESCAAYILSQACEGWEDTGRLYSDGGISGGHMERPGLKDMLCDIEAGQIDVIVVYKVDRLTRSLADFAKLVEIFDAHDVSFVSVTQAFNTTNSMGRLTLNVLLSFAQFEREVTAERIRDKIAASKKKGKWMGGLSPLGYDNIEKKLVINEAEAKTVRLMFTRYLTLGSVAKLKAELDIQRLTTKVRYRNRNRQTPERTGGLSFHRGHIYQILKNPVYAGNVRHKDQVFDGEHEGLISQATWDAVQAKLSEKAPARTHNKNSPTISLLKGILYDQTGDRLGPSHHKKAGRSYAYYISRRLISGENNDGSAWRLPAREIEARVLKLLITFLSDKGRVLNLIDRTNEAAVVEATPAKIEEIFEQVEILKDGLWDKRPATQRRTILELVNRIELDFGKITLTINAGSLDADLSGKTADIEYPISLKQRGIETRLVIGGRANNEPDEKILSSIARSRKWYDDLKSGNAPSINAIAKAEGMHRVDVGKLLPLAFMAPKIIKAFLSGDYPADLTFERLKKKLPHLPIKAADQAAYLGMQAHK